MLMMMRNKSFFYPVWITLASFLLFTWSCNTPEKRKDGLNREIMEADKPPVDTAMVLETLELYRAKRYEGIQDALAAGVENAHKLVLYGRRLGTPSPEIGRLTYLQSLDVAFNELTELPGEISNLHYLQGLYANGNDLQEFPSQILMMPILEKVELSENQISRIPGEIMKMDQLVRLSMDRNTLTAIPVQLYELENLEILELAGNGLSTLPEGISSLKKLKKLDLANNQLRSLPREITTLSATLEEMNIRGNQLPAEEIEWLISSLPETRIRY